MSFKILENDRNYYKKGYTKSNCLVSGFNPTLPATVASPFIERISKDGKEIGISLYVYQDEIDSNGKCWQHQPIKVKVASLDCDFDIGDKILFYNLECVRIAIHNNKGSSVVNYYYRASGVQLLKEDDTND